MKFDKILLTGTSDMVLFDLRDPASSPFITKSVDGLGPTEMDVTLTRSVQGLGRLSGKRGQLREITFNVMLQPRYEIGESLASVRDDLYRSYLRSTRVDDSLDLRLWFQGEEVARTPVHVKRIESSPFSKDGLLQLVLSSTDQHFHRAEPYKLGPAEAGQVSTVSPIFENIGTAATGFLASVQMLADGSSFGLSRTVPNQHFELRYDFLSGDILTFDTRPGTRRASLLRGDQNLNVLTGMTDRSSWLTLPTGTSYLEVLPDTTSFKWTHFEYNPLYLGV